MDGIVLLDGPDGIAISMTADAAEQTGRSLLTAACFAREQERPEHLIVNAICLKNRANRDQYRNLHRNWINGSASFP